MGGDLWDWYSETPTPPPAKSKPVPFTLSCDDCTALEAWAKKKGFTPGQLRYGTESVRDWAIGGGIVKLSWCMTIMSNMRRGWPLEGYVAQPGDDPEGEKILAARDADMERRAIASGWTSDAPALLGFQPAKSKEWRR